MNAESTRDANEGRNIVPTGDRYANIRIKAIDAEVYNRSLFPMRIPAIPTVGITAARDQYALGI